MLLYAIAALVLILTLTVPRTAKAHRLRRLFRAQQEWADMMDSRDPVDTREERSISR